MARLSSAVGEFQEGPTRRRCRTGRGWASLAALKSAYQQPDGATMLRVVTHEAGVEGGPANKTAHQTRTLFRGLAQERRAPLLHAVIIPSRGGEIGKHRGLKIPRA